MPQLWVKGPYRVHLWIKFLILNSVLRVSRRKNFTLSLWGLFLSCIVDEMFIDVPLLKGNSPVLKNSWLHPCNVSIIVDICSYLFKSSLEEAFCNSRCPAEKLVCSCTTLAVKNFTNTCEGVHFSAVSDLQLATA